MLIALIIFLKKQQKDNKKTQTNQKPNNEPNKKNPPQTNTQEPLTADSCILQTSKVTIGGLGKKIEWWACREVR